MSPSFGAIIFAVALVCAVSAGQTSYNFTGHTTVSGLSAGAFFAAQYHIAFSKSVSGAAIFAGGPYYCARNQVSNALTACTTVPFMLNIDDLYTDTEQFEQDNTIDPLSGLHGDRVYLYSGTADSVVHPEVVKKADEFYQHYGAETNGVYNISSEHCIPTTNYGNDCSSLGSPYISNCNYDGAGSALSYLLGRTLNPPTTPVSSSFIKLDQTKFFPSGTTVPGLLDTAYVYVPKACQLGHTCRFHIDFHGCQQSAETIQMTYVVHSGYAAWAETNGIVVLFPQAKSEMPSNMEGCLDWWGYTDANYAVQTGPQMATVKNMAEYLGAKIN